MDRDLSLAAKRPIQLQFDLFEKERRLRPANENCPFSTPRHSGGVDRLAFGFVPGTEQSAPLTRIGLSLADLEARVGPGSEAADGERD